MKMTDDLKDKIVLLSRSKSISEIVREIGCSKASVQRVLNEAKVVRSNDDKAAIRSRVRTDLIRAERRRAIFGLDQKSNLKVFSNKERNSLKYCLRRKGYTFPYRGENIALYDEMTKRETAYEERGKKLGIIFKSRVEAVSI